MIETEGLRTPPIVMDTNVVVAGACRREDSFAHRVLMGVLEKRVPLMLTEAIALEYLDVVQRPRVLKLMKLDLSEAADLVTALIAVSREVQIGFSWRPNLTDEADNKFVEAAISAAAIIVTYNLRHFAAGDLMRHGWDVMTPAEFVTRYFGEEV